MRKKRAFTLIELMVVIALIALTTGVAALKLQDLLKEQSFLDEASAVLNELRLAQDLMQIMRVDNEVLIKRTESGAYILEIAAKSQPPALGKRVIANAHLNLKAMGRIEFRDRITNAVLKENFPLTFISRGFIMNHGALLLYPKSSSPPLYIDLPGYAAPLSLKTESSYKEQAPSASGQREYIETLTNLTYQETLRLEKDEKPAEAQPNAS